MTTASESILSAIGKTPLIKLQHLGRGLPNPVWVKCEHLNPTGSIKDRAALAICEDARQRGLLASGATMVEGTAGNTGFGLALVGKVYGYNVVCVMPEKMSIDKRRALSSIGCQVEVVPNAPLSSPENFRNVTVRLAQERGWFLPDQFGNPANPRMHETTTGVEILEQTRGQLAAFVAGAGTGGTISGVGTCLKREAPGVKIVLADPAGSALAQWINIGNLVAESSYLIEGIGGSTPPPNLKREVIDEAITISDQESFETARLLWQLEGLFVGGSAGTNVAAALKLAARNDISGAVVTVLPDSWDRYRSCAWAQ